MTTCEFVIWIVKLFFEVFFFFFFFFFFVFFVFFEGSKARKNLEFPSFRSRRNSLSWMKISVCCFGIFLGFFFFFSTLCFFGFHRL